MITNDINHLENQNALYSFFLNKLGRVNYDSLIYKLLPKEKDGELRETFLIECDSEITEELVKHLKIYRVRRKIDITIVDDELKLWCLFDKDDLAQSEGFNFSLGNNNLVFKDPRLKNLGFRFVMPDKVDSLKLHSLIGHQVEVSDDDEDYHVLRYQLGVGEGIEDLPPGKAFPLESNLDYLHGVSFHKGCYIGQELTARSHHTGVIRKRLMPVKLGAYEEIFDQDQEIVDHNAKAVGKLRNGLGSFGLGLMRIEPALAAESLTIRDIPCTVEKPFWWPIEAKKPVKSN